MAVGGNTTHLVLEVVVDIDPVPVSLADLAANLLEVVLVVAPPVE